MIIEDSNKKVKRIILLLSAAVIATGLILFVVKYKGMFQISKESPKQADYIIQGVPYKGLYNHKGDNNRIAGDVSAAVASLLEYWNPGQIKPLEVSSCFHGLQFASMLEIRGCITKFGDYDIQKVHLNNDELKKYVNSEAKTPLLFFLPVSLDQPLDVTYIPAKLLIGIEESQKKVILHDFWFGNNYEVSFDDFNKLWEKTRPNFRNTYLAVQPKDWLNKLKEINSRKIAAYPSRTSIMDQAHGMFQNYALGFGAQKGGMNDVAQKYYSDVLNDPKFEDYFPPFFKVNTFTKLAAVELAQGNLDQALVHATKAVELNHDLEEPFKDWPGYGIGKNKKGNRGVASGAYKILGDIYQKQKKYQLAIDNYQKTLNIHPGNAGAKVGLEQARLGLAGGIE